MSAYECGCGWGGSTQVGFIGHLEVAHGLAVRMPVPPDHSARAAREVGLGYPDCGHQPEGGQCLLCHGKATAQYVRDLPRNEGKP